VAAAAADETHSGPSLQAGGSDKIVTIPQTPLFNETFEFAVCYAVTDGTISDATWRDTYVRMRVTKLATAASHLVTHVTDGSIARVADLRLTFTGSMSDGKWVSLVDDVQSDQFPCDPGFRGIGTVPAAESDEQHSGVRNVSAMSITVNTLTLSSSYTFAVCYTEAGGNKYSVWTDSGIRLTLSLVTSMHLGGDSGIAKKDFLSTNLAHATQTLPQIENSVLYYFGDLTTARWITFVAVHLNDANPCVNGTVAAAEADKLHSGQMEAASGTKTFILPQNASFMKEATLFTLCYATASGSKSDATWRDSYVRFHMSKITSISASSLTHATYGTLSRISPLEVTYNGQVAAERWISLVDGVLNAFSPCTNGSVAAAPADDLHSGALQAAADTTAVQLNAASLSDVGLAGLAGDKRTSFAVCYCEEIVCNSSTLWTDTGIRLRISQVKATTHWIKGSTGMPMLSVMGTLSLSTSYLSLVDSIQNSNNPCISQVDVEATAGTYHSGPHALIAGTKDVAISNIWNMDTTKLYALCYTEDKDSTEDISWRDSNIRIRLINLDSKVRRVTFLPYSAKQGLSSTTYVV
jgi:hypothetical protein